MFETKRKKIKDLKIINKKKSTNRFESGKLLLPHLISVVIVVCIVTLFINSTTVFEIGRAHV